MANESLARYEKDVLDYFGHLTEASFHIANCIICGEKKDYVELFVKGSMQVVRCKCGFIYNRHQPTHIALGGFYSTSDAMRDWAQFKTTPEEITRQKKKYDYGLRFLKQKQIRSLLDIGCGNGMFLHLANEVKTLKGSLGIDPSEPAIEEAKRLGVNVIKADYSGLSKHLGEFECISLWGVLEHVKDPVELLKTIQKYYTKRVRRDSMKRYLIVCVPNVESSAVTGSWSKCFTFCPQHLWYFSKTTLEKLFEHCGYEMLSHTTIESEAKPVIKAALGLDPYAETPPFINEQFLNDNNIGKSDRFILKSGMGYKIVAIGRLISVAQHSDHTSS